MSTLAHFGITQGNFLSQLQKVNPKEFTKGHFYELYCYVLETKTKWKDVQDALARMYKRDWSKMNKTSLARTAADIKSQRVKMKRTKPALDEYLASSFTPPPAVARKRQAPTAASTVGASPPAKKALFDSLQSEVVKLASDGLVRDLASLQQENRQLAEDNKKLKATNRKLIAENDSLKSKLRMYNPKRFNQVVKRKHGSVNEWKKKYRDMKNKTASALKLEQKLKETQESLKRLRTSKRKQQRRLQHKVSNVKQHLSQKLCEERAKMGMQLRDAQEELEAMENVLDISQEELLECQKDGHIETKQDGKTYIAGIRKASYLLQSVGVAQRNVSSTLIKTVNALTNKELVGDVPSYGTQNRFVSEMKALSRQQVKEALVDSKDTTIMYDGTTKAVGHLVEVQVATGPETEPLLLGIRQQVGGTAVEYSSTIVDACKQVENTATGHGNVDILGSVMNTMTDRCATNAAVDRQLEAVKGGPLNKFKCGMHPLDSITKECESAVKQYEQNIDVNSKKGKGVYPFLHRSESMTQSLIRTAGKIFHDTQYSCGPQLAAHVAQSGQAVAENELDLEVTGKQHVVYYRFIGNRFHIYFLCAGLLYHYADSIKDYFQSVQRPANQVQQCVYNALQIKELYPVLRSLGILGKTLTGPWMRMVAANRNILDLNTKFAEAHDNLTAWAQDASMLLTDHPSAFSDVQVKHDAVLESLLRPDPQTDAETATLLKELSAAALRVMDRQLETQLPGGTFWQPSPDLRQQAASCPSTNICGERVFAMADREVVRACSATAAFVEAKVMFKANKTGDWLQKQDPDQQVEHGRLARKQATLIIAEEKAERKVLEQKIGEKVKKARQEMARRDDKQRAQQECWFSYLYQHGGLWCDEAQMEAALQGLSKTKRTVVLKAHINIRVKVLQQSDGKVSMSLPGLLDTLLDLMRRPVPAELEDLFSVIMNPAQLVGSGFLQKWRDEECGLDKLHEGSIAQIVNEEFDMKFENGDQCYFTTDELIVDIVRGDLEII